MNTPTSNISSAHIAAMAAGKAGVPPITVTLGDTVKAETKAQLEAIGFTMSRNKRGILRREVRAYCKARDIRPVDLHRESDISHAAASKLLSAPSARAHTKSINNGTAYKLEKWMTKRNLNPVVEAVMADEPPVFEPKPATPLADKGLIQSLQAVIIKHEAEIARKDARIKLYEDELENKAKMIMVLQGEVRDATLGYVTTAFHDGIVEKWNQRCNELRGGQRAHVCGPDVEKLKRTNVALRDALNSLLPLIAE
jgi:hypothetical protein